MPPPPPEEPTVVPLCTNEQMRFVLAKNPLTRSFDDLLVLKAFISRTEFMLKSLSGVVNPRQVNDLCRYLGMEDYNDGDTIFNQGDIGDKVFILLEGACDLRVRYKIDLTQGESEIREKFIKTYTERGSYFGERALQYDEPRSGTVIASAFTTLITVSKNSFESTIREAKEQTSQQQNITTETKENVIKVLSKMRSRRTNQELDISAGYLFNRIPFFQRFNMPQLVELCRVAETISVESRSILFKQGSVGQAFYVVLSGTVEVWVNKSNDTATPTNRVQHKTHDVTDGLGIKVNQLVSGEIFGERALENEDSMRMASIVTGEGNTELIIISREDYHNMVYVMMHEDSMIRLALLRRTELFGTTDVQHLRSLSRFMIPVMYRLNQPLYIAGSKATEIIIIESGECRVETEFISQVVEVGGQQNGEGYLLPTVQHDGQYHEEEHMKAPFREDPQHLKHPELHVHPPPKKIEHNYTSSSRTHATNTRTSSHLHTLTTTTDTAAAIPKKFALPKITPQVEEKVKTDENSVANKVRMKRIINEQEQAITKAMKVNLGRIAPNSVLATYVTMGTLADDILHPETVIASSLVTAFTISKHDFCNHVPKDTRFAIEKIIHDYKPLELTSLWENLPGQIDELAWKKQRAWKMFKHDVQGGKMNNSILDAFKKLGGVTMLASGGNDRYANINAKNHAVLQAREVRSHSVQVDADWGTRRAGSAAPPKAAVHVEVETVVVAKPKSAMKKHVVKRVIHDEHGHGHEPGHGHEQGHGHGVAFGHGQHEQEHGEHGHGHGHGHDDLHHGEHGHGQSEDHYVTIAEKLHHDIELDEAAHPLHLHFQTGEHMTNAEIMSRMEHPHAPAIVTAVSHMIRTRITHSHFGEKIKKELFAIHSIDSAAPPADEVDMDTISTFELLGMSHDAAANEFSLIHLHQETGVPLENGGRRAGKCYARICGTTASSAAAVKLAKALVFSIRELLSRTVPQKKEELRQEMKLKWQPFTAFPAASDHFVVYCRGSPVMHASITPSTKIFNVNFPIALKPEGQKYACLLVRKVEVKKQKRHSNSSPHRGHSRSSSKGYSFKSGGSSPSEKNAQSSFTSGKMSSIKINGSSSPDGGSSPPSMRATSPWGTTRAGGAVDSAAEFQLLGEVLMTSSTRYECLKFAVGRFGSMSAPLPDARSDLPDAGKQAQIFLKSPKGQEQDVQLQQLHEGARVLAVPMHNWLLLDEATMGALDFVNGFPDSTPRLRFLQEELEHSRLTALAMHQKHHIPLSSSNHLSPHSPSSSNSPNSRPKRASMFTTETIGNTTTTEGGGQYNTQDLDYDRDEKDLGISLDTRTFGGLLDDGATLSLSHPSSSSVSEQTSPNQLSFRAPSAPASVTSSPLSIAMVGRQPSSKFRSIRTPVCIAESLSVVDKLQKMRAKRVTLDSVVGNYNALMAKEQEARIASNNTNTDSGSPKHEKARGKSGMPATAYGMSGNANSTVSVGRRLAENINALAESLAVKLK